MLLSNSISYYSIDLYRFRHPKEKRSKSSIIPTKFLASDNVDIHHTIDVTNEMIYRKAEADEPNKGEVVLMFPSDEA